MVEFQLNNIENCKINQYTVNWTMSGRSVYHYLSREQLYHRGQIVTFVTQITLKNYTQLYLCKIKTAKQIALVITSSWFGHNMLML